MVDGKLQWHPAFSAALRLELEDEMDGLEIREEFLLSKKPMQMDVLIIKKEKNVSIRKNIGRIFRKYNIIEYKSPEDYLSVNDFYKVYGYTCFYQSETEKVAEIDPAELTITFACSHFPYKMLAHLQKNRGMKVEKQEEGIYYLTGDAIPMQILLLPKLSKEENYWLQRLRNNLQPGKEVDELLEKYEKNRQSIYYEAVMDLLLRANWEHMKEGVEMCEALKEMYEEILKDKLTEEGVQLAKAVFKLSINGVPSSEIAKQCGISEERVNSILE